MADKSNPDAFKALGGLIFVALFLGYCSVGSEKKREPSFATQPTPDPVIYSKSAVATLASYGTLDELRGKPREKIVDALNACKNLALDATERGFITRGQIVDETWDGEIGAVAVVNFSNAVQGMNERVKEFSAGRPLNSTFAVFGLTDSISGTRKTFKTVECTVTYNVIKLKTCLSRCTTDYIQ